MAIRTQQHSIVTGWTPARFLMAGGIVLTTIGSTGATGLLSRLSSASVFNPPSWINWLHLSVGLTAISISLKGTRQLQRGITFFPAVVGTALGVIGLVSSVVATRHHILPDGSDLSDYLTHLGVGAGALWALWNSRDTGRSTQMI